MKKNEIEKCNIIMVKYLKLKMEKEKEKNNIQMVNYILKVNF